MKPRRLALIAAALGALLLLPSAVGPASGQVLPSPPPLAISDNVALIGNVPGSLFGMHFQGNYGYATGPTGLTVFDVSEAANPTIAGELPLPHFENEDVDACGNLLVIASDAVNPAAPLFVIDIANPSTPTLLATYNLGIEGTGNGAGHIANFVTKDCSLLWVDGGSRVEVVDLSQPESPRSLGDFRSEASKSDFNVTHDTERDSSGILWSVGGGGAAGYKLTNNPLQPRLVAKTGAEATNPSKLNDFILHNSQRRGQTLLVTEEDYIDTDEEQPGSCNGQGKFETYRIRLKAGKLTNLDTWKTELNGLLTGGSEDSKAPLTVNCSSHWFDQQAGIVAVGWYEQGTRFLDTTNPSNIRQVGYYLPANGSTWAAYWAPKDESKSIVYTTDAYRGLDVLRIDGGGKDSPTQRAPIPQAWYAPTGKIDGYVASKKFGYLCPIPTAKLLGR
jgi:LVIVD repeat